MAQLKLSIERERERERERPSTLIYPWYVNVSRVEMHV
jgi:hypothetical protein